jgi:hypothetical protein
MLAARIPKLREYHLRTLYRGLDCARDCVHDRVVIVVKFRMHCFHLDTLSLRLNNTGIVATQERCNIIYHKIIMF